MAALPDPHLENEEQKTKYKKKEKWEMIQHKILQIIIEHIFHKFSSLFSSNSRFEYLFALFWVWDVF
jgi:hypothetical protein